jgi:hypothetical protein
MLSTAEKLVGGEISNYLPIAEALLGVAKKYYRQGAFNMEHHADGICQAEDQAGHPCCSCPAEFYVPIEITGNGMEIFCKVHRDFNRFYPASAMLPMYDEEGKCNTLLAMYNEGV